MAVLFSAVTLTAGNNQTEFFAAGIPRSADDLDGWIGYRDFMNGLNYAQTVSIRVAAYLYGEGETVKASFAEVVYFTMRYNADSEFLPRHCRNIGKEAFTVQWTPEMLFKTAAKKSGRSTI